MFASKLPYCDGIQVPPEGGAILEKTQKALDEVVFGEHGKAWHFIARDAARQERGNGGLDQVDVKARAEAEWASHVTAMLGETDSWKEMWWTELRKIYGPLADKQLLKSTCAFHLMQQSDSATEVQKQGLRVWGQLRAPEEETAGERGKEGKEHEEGKGREEAECTAKQVEQERIFFNAQYTGGTALSGRGEAWVEMEAVRWARVGLITYGDLVELGGRELISTEVFSRRYPGLATGVFEMVKREMLAEWRTALRERRPGWGRPVTTWVGTHETLGKERKCKHEKLTVGELYHRIRARKWTVPRTFREGGDARKIWEGKKRPETALREDMGKIYAGIRHPAVPEWMADRVYKAATGTEFLGERYLGKGVKCSRCGEVATAAHVQRDCREVRKLWELVFRKWHAKTGERLEADDAWITAWGARWCTWKDEQEQEEHRPTEEVWRVIHAATVIAIREEYMRKQQRKATQMFNRMKCLVEEVVRIRRRTAAEKTFHKAWVATGMAMVKEEGAQVTIWDEKRREKTQPGGGRSGQVNDETPARGVEGIEEIYTDGTGGKGEGATAGWGWTCVAGDQEKGTGQGRVVIDRAEREYIGADKHSNNTGELSAIYWAIKEAEERRAREIVVRYDSKYAAGMARGLWQPKRNKELIRTVRRAVRDTRMVIWWKHVKGHSGHKWNDRADELAELGASQGEVREGRQPERGKGTQTKGKGMGETREVAPEEESTRGVRGLTYNANEIDRILRAGTRHGVLNTSARRKGSIRGEEIERRRSRCMLEIEKVAGEPQGRRAEAKARVERAARELGQGATRRAEERERRRVKCTEALHVPINVAALRQIAEEMGHEDARRPAQGKGEQPGRRRGVAVKSVAEILTQLEQAVQQTEEGEPKLDAEGRWELRVAYKHCERGRDLIEAGHITGAREYAIGIDPFKWSKPVRACALEGVGVGMDDNAAYMRIRMALVDTGREICEKFLRNRECVMGAYGEKLFKEEDAQERRKRMKGITCGYDMDSGPDAWAKVYGNPYGRTIVGMRVRLCGGQCKHKAGERAEGGEFDLNVYRAAQQEGTKVMTGGAPRMLEMLREQQKSGSRRAEEWKSVEGKKRTLKSFLLQEGEAASRQAKCRWCRERGIDIYQLQHDGIMVARRGDVNGMARAMSEAASAACQLRVVVMPEG